MRTKSKIIRFCIPLALIVLITIGFIARLDFGTLSSFGFEDIALLCPLGALASMLAAKIMIPRAVISLIVFVVLVVIFARAFCAWICPVPLVSMLRNIFKRRQIDTTETSEDDTETEKNKDRIAAHDATQADTAQTTCSSSCGGNCASCAAKRGSSFDSRYFVLVAALVSTFIFGFPVFCIVCPIGLTFATIMLVFNLFAFGDVTWSIIVVPVLLIIEVVVFRKWCHMICPLSAFMSLIGKLNRTFVPTINDNKCLETSKKAPCGVCGQVCSEGINLRHPELSEAAMSECSKCRACVEACPGHAITMPLIPKKSKAEEEKTALP